MNINNQASQSSMMVSIFSNEDEESNADDPIKPINEIFICFGQEEIFEGDLEDAGDFDVIEHLNQLEADLGETSLNKTSDDPHMTAILKKRKTIRNLKQKSSIKPDTANQEPPKKEHPQQVSLKELSCEIMDGVAQKIQE